MVRFNLRHVKFLIANYALQVHADASTFAEGLSKKEVYAQVLDQAKALFEGQRNWVSDPHNPDSHSTF